MKERGRLFPCQPRLLIDHRVNVRIGHILMRSLPIGRFKSLLNRIQNIGFAAQIIRIAGRAIDGGFMNHQIGVCRYPAHIRRKEYLRCN